MTPEHNEYTENLSAFIAVVHGWVRSLPRAERIAIIRCALLLRAHEGGTLLEHLDSYAINVPQRSYAAGRSPLEQSSYSDVRETFGGGEAL